MHVLDPAWEALKREFDAAAARARDTERHRLVADLSQIFRRLRDYQDEEQWAAALRDGAAQFASQFGLFLVDSGVLRLRHEQGLALPASLEFSASSARAFAAAIELRDSVVAMRSASEVGAELASDERAARVHLFPILNAGRAVAILFAAESEAFDASALELISGMASAVLERQANRSLHAQIAPAGLIMPLAQGALPAGKTARRLLPPWAALSEEQRKLHVRAQRFSRVAVAEMELARPEACRAGRKQNNLYMFLHGEIDKARETYRKQFMTVSSMVDYLHLELVNIAAEGDERRLGADYPGQLV